MLPKPLESDVLDLPIPTDNRLSSGRHELPELALRLMAARRFDFPSVGEGSREVVVMSPDVDSAGSEATTVLRQQLHQSVREILLLRAKLEKSEKLTNLFHDTVRDLSITAENITNSRGFRLLRALYAVRLFLVPQASRRERWIAGTTRVILSARQSVRAGVGRLRGYGTVAATLPAADTVAARLPASVVETAAPLPTEGADGGTSFGQTIATKKPVGPSSVERASVLEGLFDPLAWQIGATADSRPALINLLLLSVVHRSGSTLLQRLCNARKQTLIWGEHGGMLRQFVELYKTMGHFCLDGDAQRERYFEKGEDPNLWIADMCPGMEHLEQGIVEAARSLMNAFYRQYADTHDLIGFKEVQYGRAEADLLRQCFPEAEMLLLVRDPCKTWNSTPRHWYPSFENWMQTWSQHVRDFVDLARSNSRCRLIRYEDLLAREPRTIQILCDVARLTREQIEDVMAHKIGSIQAGISDDERRLIVEHCREPMEWLGYA